MLLPIGSTGSVLLGIVSLKSSIIFEIHRASNATKLMHVVVVHSKSFAILEVFPASHAAMFMSVSPMAVGIQLCPELVIAVRTSEVVYCVFVLLQARLAGKNTITVIAVPCSYMFLGFLVSLKTLKIVEGLFAFAARKRHSVDSNSYDLVFPEEKVSLR